MHPTQRLRWVQREFELRAKGWSYEKIRRQIIEEGFVRPERHAGYSTGTIENRLKSIFYRGQFEWQGAIYQGKHELIVKPEVLVAVDETFGNRQPYRRVTQAKGVFTGGWLKCAECGCSVIYDPKTKKIKGTGEVRVFHYYRCTNGKKAHATMKGMTVTEEALWEGFKETFDRVSITDELAKDIALALNEAHIKRQEAHRKELEGFERGLKNLDSKLDGVFDLFVAKAIDEDQYRRQNERIKEERVQILNLMGDARKAIEGAYLETAKSILELATSAKTLWLLQSPQERKEFLEIVLSNRVLNVRSVRYDFRKPFETLAKMSGKSEWRAREDLNL